MTTAADYIREMSAAMAERYAEDCVAHAARTAERLLAERRSPWIGRVRDVSEKDGVRFDAPLIPLRYLGKGALAWTTHYVACTARQVYDSVAGVPLDLDAYTVEVFGRDLEVSTYLDAAATARLLATGDFRSAFPPRGSVA